MPVLAPPLQPSVPYWRIILAAILDFLTVFMVIGWVVANFAGQTTEAGFNLNGTPALVFFLLLIAYFFAGGRLGGTFWRRHLRVPQRRMATG